MIDHPARRVEAASDVATGAPPGGKGASRAIDILRVAVARGLPGAAPAANDHGCLSIDVVAFAAAHRVQGLLCTAIESGAVVGTDNVVGAALDSHREALHICLISEETAVLALEALAA